MVCALIGSLALNGGLAMQAWQYRAKAQSQGFSKEEARGEYLGDDAEIRALASEKAIILFGDSIVQHWGHPVPLAVNRGIATETSAELVRRVAADVIVLKPRSLVVLGGVNDFLHDPEKINCAQTSAAIITNLQTVAEAAKAAGISVSLGSLLPNGVGDTVSPGNCWQQIPLINRALRTWAEQHRIGFLNFYGAVVNEKGHFRDGYSEDGVHPNPAGYAAMANVLNRLPGL